ncbi:MAG: CRISPR system precrRNA processing endoribonuclease RAMP protein Cas6 [Gracilibacteraceae bacterium]|jgi:hypothetical protein|nr:CRISPR system precrRNA processing endoribonuclease RAMP protein Cas6 [Gracilibacteraceae bacterium]
MNKLMLAKYRFTLRFTERTMLPPFIGNTIRGALGRALYGQIPHAAEYDCDTVDCGYNNSVYGCRNGCVYGNVFKVKSDVSIPNPYTVSVPFPSKGEYDQGEALTFFITLFGRAADYGAEIASAARSIGIGSLRHAVCREDGLVYARTWSDEGADGLPYCDALTVRFITPAEILCDKEPVTKPDFSTFINSLFGRIAGIIDNYGESPFVIPYSLLAAKPFIKSEYDIAPMNFHTGTGGRQPVNGFVGVARYFGDITPYLPYIDLGSQLHIGKKTTRGCGEYIFEM